MNRKKKGFNLTLLRIDMDTDIKTKWVAALRSGKYKQGKKTLKSHDDRYCCLGVLCELMGVVWESYQGDTYYYVDGMYCAMPPVEVADKAGLTLDEMVTLGHMNDRGETFARIADHIEASL
jgi:hypothetical protein